MPFECAQCGECCSHLGLVHRILKDLHNGRFLLYNEYTGDTQEVAIDPDKTDLFHDTGIFEREPEACPFFRIKAADGKGYCTIHATRPDICRDFSCWRVLILDQSGRRAGRIMFVRTIVTEDPDLKRLVDECIEPLDIGDDGLWEKETIRILTGHGYAVRI